MVEWLLVVSPHSKKDLGSNLRVGRLPFWVSMFSPGTRLPPIVQRNAC